MIHTELERKVKTRKNFKLDIMQPKIQNKSELPAHEYSIPDQSISPRELLGPWCINRVYHKD